MASLINPKIGGIISERKLEFFHHSSLTEWGYTTEQIDTFAVMHPSDECSLDKYPLYVVFHSAGHDIYSTLGCLWKKGNHDIYHAPKDMFALYLDCRQHMNDWWWGGNSPCDITEERKGIKKQPVENRAIATIEWVMEHYPIDKNRIYAVGNSMGGSGALGIAMCRGDIFAAVKANVPAGVQHMVDRCCLDTTSPDGFEIPDPPVLVDYSGQNDNWSSGHEILYRGMREKKYAILGFWGNFGHENNNEKLYAVNDLIHSFDISSVRLNEPYPVFTNSDSDDTLPWAGDGSVISDNAGQVNGFFRWGKAKESENSVSIPLRLLTKDDWESRVDFPTCASADVTLRRLQICKFKPNSNVKWQFGEKSGIIAADNKGLVTIPSLKITTEYITLTLNAIN